MLGHQEKIRIRICDLYFYQFIIITEINCRKPVLTDIAVFHDRSFFHDTSSCYHEKVLIIFIILYRNNGRYLFSRIQLKQVDDGRSSGRPAGLGNFIGLKPVNPAIIGKEHHIMMGGSHKQISNEILFNGLHPLDPLASAVLGFEIINCHTLDITQICHGNYRIIPGDHILHGNIILVKTNTASSVIPVFQGSNQDLFPDYAKQKLLICQNRLQFGNFCHELFMLIFQLFSFQTGKSAQSHVDDSLRLGI